MLSKGGVPNFSNCLDQLVQPFKVEQKRNGTTEYHLWIKGSGHVRRLIRLGRITFGDMFFETEVVLLHRTVSIGLDTLSKFGRSTARDNLPKTNF